MSGMKHFADRVLAAVRHKQTPAIVGLDPRPDLFPPALLRKHGTGPRTTARQWGRIVQEFCYRVLDAVGPLVPAVKLQSAFFEMHGAAGVRTLEAVLRHAHRLGILTILDAKRGDIGSTSEAYAQASFGPHGIATARRSRRATADALTVHPYLGKDSLEPFLEYTRAGDRGLFVLVLTSNPGSQDLQQLPLAADHRPVYRVVADWVHAWSSATLGRGGYGPVGAVVGGTAGAQIAELRRAMPQALLLIPGYGAQGATASDIAAAFDAQGLGALVNSSRGVLFPSAANRAAAAETEDWEQDILRALRRMIDDLATHTPAGLLRTRPGEVTAANPAM